METTVTEQELDETCERMRLEERACRDQAAVATNSGDAYAFHQAADALVSAMLTIARLRSRSQFPLEV